MTATRRKRKKVILRIHREAIYERAMDKLIKGKVPPEYVYERYQKLKEAR